MLLNKQEKQDRDDWEGKHGQRSGVGLLQAQNSGHEEMKHDHSRDDPVEHYWPHASTTAVHWDINTQYLMHPCYITKPKVYDDKRSDERSED